MFYQTQIARRQPKSSSPAAMEWFRLLLHDVICSERVTMRLRAERIIPSLPVVMGVHSAFLSLVTLSFDLWPLTLTSDSQTNKKVVQTKK